MNYLEERLYTAAEYPILQLFFADNFKKENRTKKNYAHDYNVFRSYINEKHPSTPLFALTDIDITDFFDNIEAAYKRKLATATRERIYHQLHRLYGRFVEDKLISGDPLNKVKIEVEDKDINPDKLMSYEDVQKFVRAVSTMDLREQTMLLFLLTSAPKVSELVALNWNHIFPDKNGTPAFLLIKGQREYYKKIRQEVFELLIDYKASTGRGEKIAPNESTPVFINSNGRRISESWVRKSVYAACEIAGIIQYSPSDLRNSNGAILLGAGVSEAEVSEHMGYSDSFLVKRLPIIVPNTVDRLPLGINEDKE